MKLLILFLAVFFSSKPPQKVALFPIQSTQTITLDPIFYIPANFEQKKHFLSEIAKIKGFETKKAQINLLILINNESRFILGAKNPTTGATGLIQCIDFRVFSENKLENEILNIKYYFNRFNCDFSEFSTLVFAIFYPYAISQPDTYILGSQVSQHRIRLFATQNPAYDLNRDKKISKKEVLQFFNEKTPD